MASLRTVLLALFVSALMLGGSLAAPTQAATGHRAGTSAHTAARPLTCAAAKRKLRRVKATGTHRAVLRAEAAKQNACTDSDIICKVRHGAIVCKSAMLWAMGRRLS
jgi:hypothetical protein